MTVCCLCCRLRVHNFWSHETRLPTGTLNRLVAVLQTMHSADSEHQFLSYASNFLLEMTSRSPDYNREMFEQPLSQCKFQVSQQFSSWNVLSVLVNRSLYQVFALQASGLGVERWCVRNADTGCDWLKRFRGCFGILLWLIQSSFEPFLFQFCFSFISIMRTAYVADSKQVNGKGK